MYYMKVNVSISKSRTYTQSDIAMQLLTAYRHALLPGTPIHLLDVIPNENDVIDDNFLKQHSIGIVHRLGIKMYANPDEAKVTLIISNYNPRQHLHHYINESNDTQSVCYHGDIDSLTKQLYKLKYFTIHNGE